MARPLLPGEHLIPVGYVSARYFPITKWWPGEALSLEIPGKFKGEARSGGWNTVKISGSVYQVISVAELDRLVHQRVGRSGHRIGPVWVEEGTPEQGSHGKPPRRPGRRHKRPAKRGGFPLVPVLVALLVIGGLAWLVFRK